MKFWLLKSEPQVFSYADLERAGTEPWGGVRNYQARNFLREMGKGDRALFYHSSTKPSGVAGVCEIARAAYPDPLQFDPNGPYYDPKSSFEAPRWSAVDVAPVQAFARFVPLSTLRALPELADFALLRRGSRLSVLPVTGEEWRAIVRAGGLDSPR